MNGQLLSPYKLAMVKTLYTSLINLKASIYSKLAQCLLDSGVSHFFLALDWYWKKGLRIENAEIFGV